MNEKLKLTSAILSASLLVTPISGVIYQNDNIAKANYNQKNKNIDEIFKKEKVSKDEINNFVNKYKEENKSKIQPRAYFKISRHALIKATKFLVSHSNIIPGKFLREGVQKYGPKILYAVETLEAETTIALAKNFMYYGIPEKYAYPIADFIIKYLV